MGALNILSPGILFLMELHPKPNSSHIFLLQMYSLDVKPFINEQILSTFTGTVSAINIWRLLPLGLKTNFVFQATLPN